MSSLRSLPFAVVCAIGLNDGAFPRPHRAAEFDLMAAQPRRGDRQRRDDERGLMLDLLLAARRSLYLSYTGRSVRDNASLPPSVLVSELLDVLVPAIAERPGDAPSRWRRRASGWWSSTRCSRLQRRPSTSRPTRGCAATTPSWRRRCARSLAGRAASGRRRHRRRRATREVGEQPTTSDDGDDRAQAAASRAALLHRARCRRPSAEWRQVVAGRS